MRIGGKPSFPAARMPSEIRLRLRFQNGMVPRAVRREFVSASENRPTSCFAPISAVRAPIRASRNGSFGLLHGQIDMFPNATLAGRTSSCTRPARSSERECRRRTAVTRLFRIGNPLFSYLLARSSLIVLPVHLLIARRRFELSLKPTFHAISSTLMRVICRYSIASLRRTSSTIAS